MIRFDWYVSNGLKPPTSFQAGFAVVSSPDFRKMSVEKWQWNIFWMVQHHPCAFSYVHFVPIFYLSEMDTRHQLQFMICLPMILDEWAWREKHNDAVLVCSQPFHLQGSTISFPGVITAEGRVQGFGSPKTQLSSEAVGKCFPKQTKMFWSSCVWLGYSKCFQETA